MKTIKSLRVFIFLTILFGSCFNPPEFDVKPNIKFDVTNGIRFISGNNAVQDTLRLFLTFQDGDGDLGLSPTQTDYPFHSTNYYLENNGDTTPVYTYSPYSDLLPLILVPKGAIGKLVTHRTRDKVVNGQKIYEDMLPTYTYPYTCTSYRYDSLYVSEENSGIFDATTHNIDKILTGTGNPKPPNVYVLKDTFYYKPNPFYSNISIEFYVKLIDNGQSRYELTAFPPVGPNQCPILAFNQRFPVLSDKSSPIEGTLKYDMISFGFRQVFAGKTIKVRVRVRDRALHTSNYVDTPDFVIQ